MNIKGYLRKIVTSGVQVVIKCCCFLFSKLISIGVLCDVWICADCTIHFINVLNTERAKRARKKYVAQEHKLLGSSI